MQGIPQQGPLAKEKEIPKGPTEGFRGDGVGIQVEIQNPETPKP